MLDEHAAPGYRVPIGHERSSADDAA